MSAIAPETQRARPPLWTRDYVYWLLSDTSGQLAAGIHTVATPLLAYLITGSATLAGAIGALTATAVVVGTLPGGVLADRFPRRRLMVLGALGNLLSLGVGVTLYAIGGLTSVTLGVVATLVALVGAFTVSATNAALRQLVPQARLAQAMSVNQGRDSAIALGAGPAAGALFAAAPVLPWTVALVCQGVKAVTSRRISSPLAPGDGSGAGAGTGPGTGASPQPRRRVVADLATGGRVIAHNTLLRSLVGIAALLNFAGSGILLALILGMQQSGVTPAVIGFTTTAMGAGSLIGALLTPLIIERVRTGTLLSVGFAIEAAALAAVAVMPHNPAWTLPCLTVAFIAVPMINAGCSGFIMALVPTHLQGRVGSTVAMVSLSATPLAALAAGWGVENVGSSTTIVALAGVFVAALLLTLAARSVRSIPKPAEWAGHADLYRSGQLQ